MNKFVLALICLIAVFAVYGSSKLKMGIISISTLPAETKSRIRFGMSTVIVHPESDENFPYFTPSRACYLKKFNYTQHIMRKCNFITDGGHVYPQTCKVPFVLGLLESDAYDYVLQTDVDFTILDFEHPLDDYIPEGDYHLVVPTRNPGDAHFATFSWLIKNSLIGRTFLQDLIVDMQTLGTMWGEQAGFWRIMFKTFSDYYHLNLTKKEYCADRALPAQELMDCINKISRKLNIGPMFPQKPPIFWCPFNASTFRSIGLQGKIDHSIEYAFVNNRSVSVLSKSLGIHSTSQFEFDSRFLPKNFNTQTCHVNWTWVN
jgi:hypothetical protein